MMGKVGSKAPLAGGLAIALVLTAVPLAALGLGEDIDLVAGTLDVRIAQPQDGMEFSRLDLIQFTDGSTQTGCPIASWTWEFGDQQVGTTQDAAHSFPMLGTYEATLLVTGTCGRAGSDSVILRIVNAKPLAVLSLSSDQPGLGQPITLDGTGSADPDGSVQSFRFTIDGVAQPPQSISTLSTSFTQAGDHVVSLRVVDNEAKLSDIVSAVVHVAPGALARMTVGPAPGSIAAGASWAFEAAGADDFGNPVSVSPSWSSACGAIDASGFFTAPTQTGACSVTATQGAIEDSLAFSITPGSLASITVTGPDEVVAGQTQAFSLAGSDAWGNGVALAVSLLMVQAPTLAGSAQACYEEQGISACKAYTVLADQLSSIVVSGPDTMPAGSTAAFSVAGSDMHGNAVALAQQAFAHTAATRAGIDQACFTESGITGCKSLEVVPDALATISLLGPDTLRAGEGFSYLARGADQFGNSISLAQGIVDFPPSTSTGTVQLCHTEQGITGCKSIEVTAADLATISVTGPAQVAAGDAATFALDGRDQFGNSVALAQSSIQWTAPTLAGPQLVCYEEQGSSGCASVEVLAGPLASVLVSGPDSLVAGSSASYALSGFDQYGNAVSLSQSSLDVTAPTVAGPFEACFDEGAIRGCKALSITAGPLSSITLEGPVSVPAGNTADFTVRGTDQYGNAVALAIQTLQWTAPQAQGPAQACYGEQGIQGCTGVDVTPAPLALITLSGPSQVIAGQAASFALAGFDTFGNPIALSQASLPWVAPTQAGAAQACYAEQGITGCQNVQVVADQLSLITLDGPDSLIAGTSAAYALAGTDQFGNPVALAQNSLPYTAPTSAGNVQLCHSEQGISGCKGLSIVPDALSSIVVSGPSDIVVGQSAAYALAGFDQYGNSVALSLASLAHQAPTLAGPGQVCHAEQAISGCASVLYVADSLSVIALTGPAQVVASGSALYGLAGADQFGNPVTLAQSSLAWTAPAQVGTQQVCYAEQGISGCTPVEVVADALDTIAISGPDEMTVGSTATFLLSGADQYGNAVPLAQSSLDHTAPTIPGFAQVCHSEEGATGCKTVSIVHGPLASILVTGPASMVVAAIAAFDMAGYDSFGNPVALAQSTLSWTAPNTAGPGEVCHEEQGIRGCTGLIYVAGALSSIALSGPGSVPAGDTASFSLAGSDQFGNPVALAQSSLQWLAPTLAGTQQVCYTEEGVQGCAPVEVTHAALALIGLSGPGSAAAGSIVAFALAGTDSFGNSVPLAASSFDWTAPTLAGPAQACYEEQGIEGCSAVLVTPGVLSRISVTPGNARTNVNQGKDIAFSARGLDAYGNEVGPLSFTWTATAGRINAQGVYQAITSGTHTVTATAGGVSGSAPVQVLNVLTMRLSTTADQYHLGAPVRGFAQLTFADGDVVPNAKVALKFTGTSLGLGSRCSADLAGFTNGAGVFAWQAPSTCADMLGDYKVEGSALWKTNRGAAIKTYRITI